MGPQGLPHKSSHASEDQAMDSRPLNTLRRRVRCRARRRARCRSSDLSTLKIDGADMIRVIWLPRQVDLQISFTVTVWLCISKCLEHHISSWSTELRKKKRLTRRYPDLARKLTVHQRVGRRIARGQVLMFSPQRRPGQGRHGAGAGLWLALDFFALPAKSGRRGLDCSPV